VKICPITYKECGERFYSSEGLKLLSVNLEKLILFPYSAEEQRQKALTNIDNLNLPGCSLKLNARLNIQAGCFELSGDKGNFILKPQDSINTQIPENEDLTMHLANAAGVEVPLHGLIYNEDKTMTYFIQRFDRSKGKQKFYTEDFAQLSGNLKEEKFNSTMEDVSLIIDKYCTFPVLEKIKFFRIVILNYLIGNSESHLKKFSVIRRDKKIEFGPFYDLVNTSITGEESDVEIALPLNNKRNNLSKNDFIEYYAKEILVLNNKTIFDVLSAFENAMPLWLDLIRKSFLNDKMKEKYFKLLEQRILKFFKN